MSTILNHKSTSGPTFIIAPAMYSGAEVLQRHINLHYPIRIVRQDPILLQQLAEGKLTIEQIPFEGPAQRKLIRHWGMYFSTLSESLFKYLSHRFTSARYLFIYRNLFDAARQAKSAGVVHSINDCRRFASEWSQQIQTMLNQLNQLDSPCMVVRYEHLFGNNSDLLCNLHRHIGDNKNDSITTIPSVNPWDGKEAELYQLSDDESDVLFTYAADMLQRLNYTDTRRNYLRDEQELLAQVTPARLNYR